jgi:hypothetical protein
VTEILKRPDRTNYFSDWINAEVEDLLVIGALAAARLRTAGGDPGGLRTLDAAKIVPIVMPSGMPPPPPASAYYWYAYGVPYREYTTDEIIYRPFNRRSWTPYGFGAVEQLVLLVTLQMNAVLYRNYAFTEGNMPPHFLELPESWPEPKIREFQQYLDQRLTGNLAARARAIAVPSGTKVNDVTQPYEQFQYEFEEYIIRCFCGCLGVDPQFIMKSTGLGGTSTGMGANARQQGLQPYLQFFAETFNDYIANDLGNPDLEFQWIAEAEANQQLELETQRVMMENGAMSINEWRRLKELPPDSSPEADMLMVKTASGLVPVAGSSEEKEPPPQLAPFAGQANPPAQKDEPEQDGPEDEQKPGKEPPKPTAKADVAKWAKVARKAARAGKPPRPFTSDAIAPGARYWIESHLASGDVEKAFRNPKHGADPQKSERLALHLAHGTMLWAGLYRRWVNKWLAVSERVMSEAQKADGAENLWGWGDDRPTDKRGWDDLVAWLEDCWLAGKLDAADVVGLGKVVGSDWAATWAGKLVGMSWDDEDTGELVYNPNEYWDVADTVRETIHDATLRAIENGESYGDLRHRINEQFTSMGEEAGESRALMVARTEAQRSYNSGAAANYSAVGVEYVEISDGGGSTSCEECEAVNGQVWTVERFLEEPLAHPNCGRYSIPLPFYEGEVEE